MPCTFTGTLDGDRIMSLENALDRRERYLCAICRYIEAQESLNLFQILRDAARTSDGVSASEIERWWKAHRDAEDTPND